MVSGNDAVKAPVRIGFVFVWQKGSHAVLRCISADGVRGCVVPMHSEIQPGTLRGMLKQAGISIEEFRNAL